MYVASISDGYCKSRSGCCTSCNGYTRMYQASVSNVSSVFSDVCCKCFYLDVAYVSHICCKCVYLDVAYVLQWFFKCFQVFLQVFQTYISSVSFIFKRILQMFHMNVSKVDQISHMLQCDSLATGVCCSCWGVMHACGKRRDGALRGGRCGKQRGKRGCAAAAGVRPDVQALVLPIYDTWSCTSIKHNLTYENVV